MNNSLSSSKIDSLLKINPYSLSKNEKQVHLMDAIKENIKFQFSNSKEYKKYCDKKSFDPNSSYNFESIPFLPVTLFKKIDLLSVPRDQIVKVVRSSSTTGNLPSVINLDKITSTRQILALNSILQNFLGMKKKHFIILDAEKTIDTRDQNLSSRGSAIRGILSFSKSFNFILDENLEINLDSLKKSLSNIDFSNTCIFGFTWLIYQIISKNYDDSDIKEIFKKFDNPTILHIGGWKKLQEKSISKNEFNLISSKFFNTKNKIIDFYGMTEQLGVVFPDCEEGYKHVPNFAEIIIRDTKTLNPQLFNQPGFIQIISPIPNSYPGISLLTDDIGEILGEDDCSCGRKGKYFIFKSRSEVADPKGCGDTLDL